jgi:ABC-type glycerol-3-phosphate transport system permease component
MESRCLSCQPKRCCVCLDIHSGTTLIGLSQLFFWPILIVLRSVFLENDYMVAIVICPLICFIYFLKLAKTDTVDNRRLFYRSLLISFVVEVTISASLLITGMLLGWHISECDAAKYRIELKLVCTPWYRPLQLTLEAVALVLKPYFIFITRQNWLNML